MKNVILFTIDTLRVDVLGCYGGTGLTPFIDSIQDKCIRFNRSQAVGPYTQASFPGILTSSYFLEYDRSPKLPPNATLVSEPLKNARIYTAAFHSNPYMSGYFGWNRGWDHFYDSMADKVDEANPYIKGDILNKKVQNWLSGYVSGESHDPFFLWLHYMDVHEPYTPENDYLKKIDPSLSFSTAEYMALFKEIILPRDATDPKKVELLKKLYLAHVVEVDEYVAELFGILEKSSVLDDTVVIITSDHGDEFGEHGSLSHDGKMYSELIHVPLMIYDSRLDQGQTCDNLVSGVDIPPTILDLFGVKSPPTYKGQTLLPVDKYISKGCFGECICKLQHRMQPTDKPAYYYREENQKIIYREDSNGWEFYDLEADPSESNNIVDSSPHAEDFKARLTGFINRNK